MFVKEASFSKYPECATVLPISQIIRVAELIADSFLMHVRTLRRILVRARRFLHHFDLEVHR